MGIEQMNTFQDFSGSVTISVFRVKSPSKLQQHFDLAVNVPEDMVAIGGGAVAVEYPVGALLTASYPNEDLSAWLVSSKDHGSAEPHFLTGYAIGLRIRGMDRRQLLENIRVSTNDSGSGQHPEATATLHQQYLLVSGGFKVEWSGHGNLATASYPSSSYAWTARSKDHRAASPANIRSYAIGIRPTLPNGRLMVSTARQESANSQHPAAVANLNTGYALTGGGAEAHWRTAGSLLWKMQPGIQTGNQEFSVSSKDHQDREVCTITAYALGIQYMATNRTNT